MKITTENMSFDERQFIDYCMNRGLKAFQAVTFYEGRYHCTGHFVAKKDKMKIEVDRKTPKVEKLLNFLERTGEEFYGN